MSLDESLKSSLKASVYLSPLDLAGAKGFERLDLHLDGRWAEDTFRSDGRLTLQFKKEKRSQYSPQSLESSFEGLTMDMDAGSRLRLRVARGKLAYWISGNEHAVSAEDISATVNLGAERFHILEFGAPLYGGEVDGRVWVDMENDPPRLTANMNVDSIRAEQLKELLVHFGKLKGRMSGRLQLVTDPKVVATGEFSVRHGILDHFEFFEWMGATFHLPSLNRVEFREASTDLRMDVATIALENLKLDADKVGLEGYFHVDKSGLVNSKLSLSFSRKLVQESPKLRPLLGLFREKVPFLVFDFQLSGHQDAMNFQWLQSDFKKRIQERIPNFIERAIEKRIDDIMTGTTSHSPPKSVPGSEAVR